jgi:general secretion pathway protein D
MTRTRLTIAVLLLLAGCASPALREADDLVRRGDQEAALRVLRAAAAAAPDDRELRAAVQRQRDRSLLALATQAEGARAVGQLDLSAELLQRMEAIDADAPRTRGLRVALLRARSHEARAAQASRQLQAGQLDAARDTVTQVLAEDPGQPLALSLQQRLRQRYAPPPVPSSLSAAYQKPVSLEFREAPLRTVFEALGRGAGINFVFDKDVKGDAHVTLYLKDVSVDEAMRIVLSTQQLERKLLNDNSVLIYPNTPAKQREHQELVTRSFYLNNADVKQAQALVRMMAKTRDLFIDERLNLLVARDTPEVVAMIEQLVAGLDLPEPEVMLDVEVLELATDKSEEAGLNWASDASFGSLDGAALTPWSARAGFRTLVANPVVAARLKGTTGDSNLLANPKLRARNKEKAKIQIGDKVPVFTSTSTANVGVSTAVTYIDVGLKLEVEPSIQLDNEVVMKVNLEVSSLGLKESSGGPQPTSAYRIGSRAASTSLRLRDGETQVLAGLINDEDRKNISGLPYAAETPLLGRLFGVHTDSRKKTEIVLLITPHVLRNLSLPDASRSILASGFDANPGAEGVRLRSRGSVAAPLSGGAGGAAPAPAAIAHGGDAVVELQTTDNAAVGETLSVTLANRSALPVRGLLSFDVALFTRADVSGPAASTGSVDVELGPQGQQVVVLRVRPGAAGQVSSVELSQLRATTAQGESQPVRVEGQGDVTIRAH